MTSRWFISLCLWLPFLVSANEERPNVILVLVDDFGRELIGAFGGESYETPNIDQLVADGMCFESCYATPMCSPTRNLLLSGKYNFRNYTTWGEYDFESQPTVANLVGKAGYRTGMAGKWHLGGWDRMPFGPTQAGFQEYATFNYPEQLEEDAIGKGNFFWNTHLWVNDKRDRLGQRYSSAYFRQFTVEFIERADREQPFFFYYPMILTHRPFMPTDIGEKSGIDFRGRRGDPSNFSEMVGYVDSTIGAIRQALDRKGLLENTLLIFTADNGTDAVGEAKSLRHRWKGREVQGGKYLPTEMGANVPFIACWPGTIKAGSRYPKPIDFSDILPTVCGLAKAKISQNSDGNDLTPVLISKGKIDRRYAYTWGVFERSSKKYKAPQTYAKELLHIIRDERWKYISDGRLYDLTNDPFEEAPVEGHSKVRLRLSKALAELRASEPKLW